MSSMSDYLEFNLHEHILNANAFAVPTPIWISLYTSDPNDDDTGTEVSGNGYARVEVDSGTVDQWSVGATNGTATNLNAIVFPQASGGNWGTVTFSGVHDAVSGGNLLYRPQLVIPRTINDGDPPVEFAPGSYVIVLS